MSNTKKTSITVQNWFLPLLSLLFIYLKLTSVITWSWWLVLLPLYVLPVAALSLIGIYLLIAVLLKP